MAYTPIPPLGQATSANSSPVVIASDQSPINTSNNFHVNASDTPNYVVVTGEPTGDFAGVSLLEAAADPLSGTGFNVNVQNPPKADISGAAIASDCPKPITLSGGVGQIIIIDTQGYASFSLTSQAMSASITASNDLITFNTVSFFPVAIGTPVITFAANFSYVGSCLGRYLKFTIVTAGTATLYLRNKMLDGAYQTQQGVNVAFYAGGAAVNAGAVGVPSVGGNIAAGLAPTANPVLIGGIDTSGLTRRLLTDTSGRAIVAGNIAAAQSIQNAASVGVQDQTVLDGSLIIELLQQLLVEARIANYQRHEFNFGVGRQSDDPEVLRTDPTLTIIN